MKTRKEVRELQDNWHCDPCWDIEKTEGFEEYRGELLSYRISCEEAWDKRREERLIDFAKRLDLSHSPGLAEYIFNLNQRLRSLEDRIRDMEEQ